MTSGRFSSAESDSKGGRRRQIPTSNAPELFLTLISTGISQIATAESRYCPRFEGENAVYATTGAQLSPGSIQRFRHLFSITYGESLVWPDIARPAYRWRWVRFWLRIA